VKIEFKDLTKKFGTFTAVDKLNLSLESGESFGFLGPNGAGKTTTLLTLLGIYQPDSGQILIDGQPVNAGTRRKIGVVAEYQTFYDEMTAREYLDFFGRLYQVADAQNKAKVLLERLQLADWADALIGNFSTGMKKKLGIVRGLIHSPELLILDEPVSGLDPFGIMQVRELIQEQHKLGTTLIISSHVLSEIEKTVSRVGIISKGKLLKEGSIADILGGQKTFSQWQVQFLEFPPNAKAALAAADFTLNIEEMPEQNTYQIQANPGSVEGGALGRFALQHGLITTQLHRQDISLEAAFIKISEESLQNLV